VAREGLEGVVRGASQRFFPSVFEVRKATLFARALEGPIPEFPASVPVSVREMTLEDLGRFRDPQSFLRERRIMAFAQQLKTGRVGVIAMVRDHVAGYGWVSLQDEIEDRLGVKVSLQRREGYIFVGFVFPPFRGRGIYPALLKWRLDYLKRHGCRTAYSIVAVGNVPAQTWHRRMGFRPQREVGYMRLLGLKWYRSRPLCTAGAEGQ
jgi:GNAT superfamily N-acetyltransferase